MASGHLTTTAPIHEAVSGRKVLTIGLLTLAATVAANVVAALLLRAPLGVSPDFLPFQPGPIAAFTFLQVGLGVIVFALLARFTRRPLTLFRAVGLVALVLSCIPNVAIAAGAMAPMIPGTPAEYLSLIIFHVIAGALAIGMLTTLTRAD